MIKKQKQKYKIFMNAVEVILTSSAMIKLANLESPGTLLYHYNGIRKDLLKIIDFLEGQKFIDKCYIYAESFVELKQDFLSYFTEIEAGGGLVRNDKGEYLLIYRRGSWDLPKGKIESGESKKGGSIREIEEETGVNQLRIIHKIGVTRHTYRNGQGKRLIKKSHWYLMETKKQKLIPQVTEDIEKAVWMQMESFFKKHRQVYPNIIDVLKTEMEQREESA